MNGTISSSFYDALGPAIKQKFFFTVIGNHDYWVDGVPHSQTAKDQFGNGFMQYWPMDSIASAEATPPAFLNFSSDPNVVAPDGNHSVADPSNFFWPVKILQRIFLD